MARCIVREVKEGRGSPHGGVFLDIAWIKEKIPNAPEHIRRKLPSMYHQFKELAGIDITVEPMEVGPTTHYVMGGIRVDSDTQMSTVPGLFAAGECAAGLHGANRLGGNSLSDLVVFGKRAGEHAAAFANERGLGEVNEDELEEASRQALSPLERQGDAVGAGPYKLQMELQDLMQDKVGIIRKEDSLAEAVDEIRALSKAVDGIGVGGDRHFNPGWHTSLDLRHLLTVAEALRPIGARAQGESGCSLPNRLSPTKTATGVNTRSCSRRGRTGRWRPHAIPFPRSPTSYAGSSRSKADGNGDLQDLAGRCGRWEVPGVHHRTRGGAWSFSMPYTRSRRSRHTTWRSDGTARRASAGRVPPRSTACPGSCA